MKPASSLIALAALSTSALLLASPSFATGEADTYANQFAPTVSQATRAQVHTQADARAQQKTVDPTLQELSRVEPLPAPTRTRAEVRAEAAKANRLGQIPHGDLPY